MATNNQGGVTCQEEMEQARAVMAKVEDGGPAILDPEEIVFARIAATGLIIKEAFLAIRSIVRIAGQK